MWKPMGVKKSGRSHAGSNFNDPESGQSGRVCLGSGGWTQHKGNTEAASAWSNVSVREGCPSIPVLGQTVWATQVSFRMLQSVVDRSIYRPFGDVT